jgi:hypothetical protein
MMPKFSQVDGIPWVTITGVLKVRLLSENIDCIHLIISLRNDANSVVELDDVGCNDSGSSGSGGIWRYVVHRAVEGAAVGIGPSTARMTFFLAFLLSL